MSRHDDHRLSIIMFRKHHVPQCLEVKKIEIAHFCERKLVRIKNVKSMSISH